jgi:hypothetical protein
MEDGSMAEEKDTPFLSRWAQRKKAARRAPRADAEAKSAEAASSPPDLRESETAAVAELAFDPATLPKVEDLTATSDITAFLRKGVPEELKRLALRRVWALDPQIRDFIEVAENQYDWNAVDGVPGFGTLHAGTDLQALLAQATGKIREIVAPDEAVLDVSVAPVPTPAMSPSISETSLDAACERDAASATAEAETPPTREDAPAPRASRRRHGGALPETKPG